MNQETLTPIPKAENVVPTPESPGLQLDKPLSPELSNILAPDQERSLLRAQESEQTAKIEKTQLFRNDTDKRLDEVYENLGIPRPDEKVPSIAISEQKEEQILAEKNFITERIIAIDTEEQKRRAKQALLKKITNFILKKAGDESLDAFIKGFQSGASLFAKKNLAENSEMIEKLTVFVNDHGEITEEDLETVPDIKMELEREAFEEAKEAVAEKSEEKGEPDSSDALTPIEGTDMRHGTIGYEEGKYASAEALTSHIENQMKGVDVASSQPQVKADLGSFSQN